MSIATARPRARPLWEVYVIHGLESGHTAVLTKIHHSLIDGSSKAPRSWGVLFDLAPEGREWPEPSANGADPAARRARDAHPGRWPSAVSAPDPALAAEGAAEPG